MTRRAGGSSSSGHLQLLLQQSMWERSGAAIVQYTKAPITSHLGRGHLWFWSTTMVVADFGPKHVLDELRVLSTCPKACNGWNLVGTSLKSSRQPLLSTKTGARREHCTAVLGQYAVQQLVDRDRVARAAKLHLHLAELDSNLSLPPSSHEYTVHLHTSHVSFCPPCRRNNPAIPQHETEC